MILLFYTVSGVPSNFISTKCYRTLVNIDIEFLGEDIPLAIWKSNLKERLDKWITSKKSKD